MLLGHGCLDCLSNVLRLKHCTVPCQLEGEERREEGERKEKRGEEGERKGRREREEEEG